MAPKFVQKTASFEGRRGEESRTGVRRVTSDRLSPEERAELAYLWGGYEAALGVKSLHGAIEAKLLRSAPRDARRVVLRAVESLAGHAERDRLAAMIAAEGEVTLREAEDAIHDLLRIGNLTRDEAVPGWVALSHTKLPRGPSLAQPDRWQRDDEELERLGRGGWKCKDVPAAYDFVPHMPRPPSPAVVRALAFLTSEQRQILRGEYGLGSKPVNRASKAYEIKLAAACSAYLAKRWESR